MFSLINLLYVPVIFVPTTVKMVLQNVKRINAEEKGMWEKGSPWVLVMGM